MSGPPLIAHIQHGHSSEPDIISEIQFQTVLTNVGPVIIFLLCSDCVITFSPLRQDSHSGIGLTDADLRTVAAMEDYEHLKEVLAPILVPRVPDTPSNAAVRKVSRRCILFTVVNSKCNVSKCKCTLLLTIYLNIIDNSIDFENVSLLNALLATC